MAKIASRSKKCTKCKEVKDISQFRQFFRRGRVEAQSKCASCERECGREWFAKNRDGANERSRAKHQKHKAQYNQRSREWRKENLERERKKGREKTRKFVELYPEKKRLWDRRYYENNKDKFLSRFHTRRAKIKGCGGVITSRQRRGLFEKYGNRCINPNCANPYIHLTLDHVVPIALGGANSVENSQPLCKSCNSRKQTKVIDYRVLYD